MFSFHLPTLDSSAESLTLTEPELVHQMNRVLRFQPGEQVYFLDGAGRRARAELTQISKKEAMFAILECESQPAPTRTVTLAFGIPKKPATLEWMLEKATELGVSVLQPLVTEHGQTAHLPKPERLHKILLEACEQSERWFFPELKTPITLEAALKTDDLILAGDARRGQAFEPVVHTQNVTILIGPEGGFSPHELEQIDAAGAHLLKLGSNVLRVETAALTFLSLVNFA